MTHQRRDRRLEAHPRVGRRPDGKVQRRSERAAPDRGASCVAWSTLDPERIVVESTGGYERQPRR